MRRHKSSVEAPSGSPSRGEPEFLVVGTVRRPHGLRGEVLLEILTDFPERLQPGSEIYLGASRRGATIDGAREHHRGMLLKLRGIDDPEAAGNLRNESVYVRTAERPKLPAGLFYHHQLLGSLVMNESNDVIGTLVEILETGANDVYVVRDKSGGEVLLPVIESVVLEVDPALRLIHVRVPDGLQGQGHGA